MEININCDLGEKSKHHSNKNDPELLNIVNKLFIRIINLIINYSILIIIIIHSLNLLIIYIIQILFLD